MTREELTKILPPDLLEAYDKTDDSLMSDEFKAKLIEKLNTLRPEKEDFTKTKRKKICAECAKWEPGPMWMASDGKHGVFIECKGWCLLKKNKRKRWNYNPACGDGFEKKERNGFIYCGNGEPTEEDLENITELTEELIRDDGNIKGFRAFR